MSNTATLSWSELWSVYRRSPPSTQQDILEQIELPELLATASESVKQEVLAEAPQELKPASSIVVDALEQVYKKWGRKSPKRR